MARRGQARTSRAALVAAALLAPSCVQTPADADAEPASANTSAHAAHAEAESLPAEALSFEEAMAIAEPSLEEQGLPVGQHAPAFILEDQNGREVSLESLLKQGPVALVFYRSAHWCFYCKMQCVQLQQNLEEIEAGGGQVVGISYDSAEILRDFAARCNITFPLLSDVGSRIIDAYGIRNTKDPSRDGSANHGTFIVDQESVIRSKLFQVSYAERPAVVGLVQALEAARCTSGGSNQ